MIARLVLLAAIETINLRDKIAVGLNVVNLQDWSYCHGIMLLHDEVTCVSTNQIYRTI
jgi:hypothetical protein